MTSYFLDASALVKRYIREAGTAWILGITTPSTQHSIILAEISLAGIIFVASDGDLLRAAVGEGMATDNPVDHAGAGQTL